jgi:hypothetical protein
VLCCAQEGALELHERLAAYFLFCFEYKSKAVTANPFSARLVDVCLRIISAIICLARLSVCLS